MNYRKSPLNILSRNSRRYLRILLFPKQGYRELLSLTGKAVNLNVLKPVKADVMDRVMDCREDDKSPFSTLLIVMQGRNGQEKVG